MVLAGNTLFQLADISKIKFIAAATENTNCLVYFLLNCIQYCGSQLCRQFQCGIV